MPSRLTAIGLLRIPWGFHPPPRPRIPSRSIAVGLLLAHAVSFTVMAHSHYVFHRVPTRLGWALLELLLATVLWPVGYWYAAAVCRRLTARTAVVPVALGLLVSRWWAGTLYDTLWLFPVAARPALGVGLAAAHAIVPAAVYAGLLALVVRTDRPVESPVPPGQSYPLTTLLVLIGFAAVGSGFAGWYVSRERAVYYHDCMFYWQRSADLADVLRTDPGSAWDVVRGSVQRDDYGLTPAVGPAVVMAVAGNGRAVYVAAVTALYLTPFAFAARLIVGRFVPESGRLAAVVPAVLLLGLPTAWGPLLRGYLDVGGAALVTLAAAVYWSRPAGEHRWPRLLATATLLAAAVFFRRWYAFFVVSFLVAAGVEAILARRPRSVIVVGAATGLLILSFAAHWAVRVAPRDIGGEMTAWRSPGSVTDRALVTIDILGPGYALAAAAAGVALLVVRRTRRPAAYLLATAPLIAALFLRVQDLYPHHLYLFLPALIVLPALAVAWLRWPGVLLAAVVGAAGMAATFVPEAAGLHARLWPALSRLDWRPLQRDDLPALRRLLRVTGREAGRVAVLASSTRLNQSALAYAGRSLGEDLPGPDHFVAAPEIDRTDGFPVGLFAADLVVVADPPQTHLSPTEQRVVTIPAEMLLTGEGIGAAFDPLPERFAFPGGVTVRLFHRARPVSPAAVADLSARLRAAHPDCPVLFEPPAAVAELSARTGSSGNHVK